LAKASPLKVYLEVSLFPLIALSDCSTTLIALAKMLSSIGVSEIPRSTKAEEKRITDAKKAEEKRIADAKKAEEKRIADIKAAEETINSYLKIIIVLLIIMASITLAIAIRFSKP
jgi:hypothetical protein